MSNELQGLSVLVTRPKAAGLSLCERVQSQGGEALHFPTIEFDSLTDSMEFKSAISNLKQQDCLIFVSPHAVKEALPAINTYGGGWPKELVLAAVGEGTANELSKFSDRDVLFPKTKWNSEALLALDYFQQVKQKRIMIVKGVGGRELLQQTLEDRGAVVSFMIAYKRELPKCDAVNIQSMIEHRINVTICTSYTAIEHLKTLVGKDNFLKLSEIPMIVISERLKALAENAGFRTIWVAKQAGNEAILEILATKKDVICQKMKAKS